MGHICPCAQSRRGSGSLYPQCGARSVEELRDRGPGAWLLSCSFPAGSSRQRHLVATVRQQRPPPAPGRSPAPGSGPGWAGGGIQGPDHQTRGKPGKSIRGPGVTDLAMPLSCCPFSMKARKMALPQCSAHLQNPLTAPSLHVQRSLLLLMLSWALG